MEFPDELLDPGMVISLAGKEPVLIAIIARDEEGELHPHVAVADVSDDERPYLSAAVQKLAYVVGYPDLEVEEFFALSLVLLKEPLFNSPVMGMTAGVPFGPPEGFMKAFASVLAGVGAKLGVGVGVSGGVETAMFVGDDGELHWARHGHGHGHGASDEPPTGQYL